MHISNFDDFGKIRHIAVGKTVQLIFRRPLSLNDTYAYLKTTFKLESEETDFYFSDEQMQVFLGFVMMIRLLNNLRSFIKKWVFSMGKDDCINFKEELENLYKYQSSDIVESTLVPNVRFPDADAQQDQGLFQENEMAPQIEQS